MALPAAARTLGGLGPGTRGPLWKGGARARQASVRRVRAEAPGGRGGLPGRSVAWPRSSCLWGGLGGLSVELLSTPGSSAAPASAGHLAGCSPLCHHGGPGVPLWTPLSWTPAAKLAFLDCKDNTFIRRDLAVPPSPAFEPSRRSEGLGGVPSSQVGRLRLREGQLRGNRGWDRGSCFGPGHPHAAWPREGRGSGLLPLAGWAEAHQPLVVLDPLCRDRWCEGSQKGAGWEQHREQKRSPV